MGKHVDTVGIVGGGQLAQMMTERASRVDAKIKVLADDISCPAASAGALVVQDFKDFEKNLTVATIENEFLNVDQFEDLSSKFLPNLENLRVAQNKLNQKFLFKKLGLRTANFKPFDVHFEKLEGWLAGLKLPVVLKWAMGGYDGKGNYFFKTLAQISDAIRFCQNAIDRGNTVYAEDFLAFQSELAMVYVRGQQNQISNYPLVISEQERGICRTVYGPAVFLGFDKAHESFAIQCGQKIAEELNLVGSFAIEFFLFQNQLWINEMAPRVHNSGHFSQDACSCDQFENHLRAILGHRIVEPKTEGFFMMRNILGIDTRQMDRPPHLQDPNLKLHWYNKADSRPGRKMGHINALAKTPEDLPKIRKRLVDAEAGIWQG